MKQKRTPTKQAGKTRKPRISPKNPEDRYAKLAISMPGWMAELAQQKAAAMGYSTFSSYIQALVHADTSSWQPHVRRARSTTDAAAASTPSPRRAARSAS